MYNATFYEPRQKCTFWFFQVRCAHKSGDVINLTIVACRIFARLKWYKNYKNRLRLTKVIVKNKMSRFYGSLCRIDRLMCIGLHTTLPNCLHKQRTLSYVTYLMSNDLCSWRRRNYMLLSLFAQVMKKWMQAYYLFIYLFIYSSMESECTCVLVFSGKDTDQRANESTSWRDCTRPVHRRIKATEGAGAYCCETKLPSSLERTACKSYWPPTWYYYVGGVCRLYAGMYVCMYYDNFRKPWGRKMIFGHPV